MKKNLRHRLNDYSVAAKSLASKRILRDRGGRWPIYAAVTGSALAMATSASASIISYDGLPVTVTAAPGSVAFTGVPVPGMPAFALSAHLGSTFGHASAGNAFNGGSNLQLLAISFRPFDLTSHATVGPAEHNNFWQANGELVFKSRNNDSGAWLGKSDQPGFEGFRFGTGHGGFDYGWAQISWSANGAGIPDSVTLYALAYDNTPNQAIDVGDSGPSETPEPGTAGLMLVALGAAGVGVLRKQKAIN
jgi:hypothetical protein